MSGRALFMILLMLLSPVPAAYAAAGALPGGASQPRGDSPLGKAINLMLITLGLRDPPFEPLGGKYTHALKELSRLKQGFKGELSLFRMLTEDIRMELEEGDTEDALKLVDFYLTVLNQSKSELATADERFRSSADSVTKKLKKVKKRIPRQKLEKHEEVVALVTQENRRLLSSLENLSAALTRLREEIASNHTSEAMLALAQVEPLLSDITPLLEKPAKPAVKVKAPEQLPTRPSGGKPIKPRTTFPKEKPKPLPKHAEAREEKPLLGRLIEKLTTLLPSAFAEEQGDAASPVPPEIANLSAQLDHNPAKIYAYVRDEIEYTPYYGYMKGSLWTMWEKAGNDFDQAALLSDLLRAAGYQTRFVIGTVEVEPEYMMQVLGVNTTEEALQLLWENYVPAELSNKKILVEHVWVEVKLPYGMYSDECYRGYIANREACGNAPEQWIPLDPTFVPYKPKEPYPTADLDYDLDNLFEYIINSTKITEDYTIFSKDTVSMISNSTAELKNQSDQWYYENIGLLHKNLTWEEFDALYASKPPKTGPEIIPGTLPYSVVVSERYNKIPAEFVHLIKIEIVEEGKTVLSFNISSVNTLGNQITIDYIPADDSMSEFVNSQESLTDIPAYMLDYRPVLRVNSLPFALGNASSFGVKQELRVSIITPNNLDVVSSPLEVGGYYAVAFDLGKMPSEVIKKQAARTLDGIYENLNGNLLIDHALGASMYLSLLSYFEMTDLNSQLLAEAQGVRWWRASPSVAVLGVTFDTDYLGSVPTTIEPGYTHIDLARNILSIQGSSSEKKKFAFMAGAISSSWEHVLFDTLYNSTGVSTINLFKGAAELGVPIVNINQHNIDKLNISEPNIERSIKNAVEQGYTVFAPMNFIRIGKVKMYGWLVLDPATGANAWMIADELGTVINGGSTEKQELNEILDKAKEKNIEEFFTDLGKESVWDTMIESIQRAIEENRQLTVEEKRFVDDALKEIGTVETDGNTDVEDSLSLWDRFRTPFAIGRGIVNDRIKTQAKKTEQEVEEIRGIRDALKNSVRTLKGWVTRYINMGDIEKAIEAEKKYMNLDSVVDDLSDILVDKETKLVTQKTAAKAITGLGALVVASEAAADIEDDFANRRWDKFVVDTASCYVRVVNSIAWDVAEIGSGFLATGVTVGASLFIDETIKKGTEYIKTRLDKPPVEKDEQVIELGD